MGGDVTLNVISDNTDNWEGILVLSEDVMGWTTPVAADWTAGTASGIGNLGAITYNFSGYHAAIDILVASNLAPTDVVAGTQFSIKIIPVQASPIYISLQDPTTQAEITTNGAPLAFVLIPEPMTIGLLGLGVLFLRHRK
ncbi:MAG: PEP-CTERM sorting domain-containing protein [Sedimentisphaerales bacterium]